MTSFWNWLELSLFVGISSSIGLYVAILVMNTRNFTSYFNNPRGYTDLTRDAYLCSVWQSMNAFNLFILMMMVSIAMFT